MFSYSIAEAASWQTAFVAGIASNNAETIQNASPDKATPFPLLHLAEKWRRYAHSKGILQL